jgi:hypothetical protein
MNKSLLLSIDAVINLVLGILLMWFPRTIVQVLGIPQSDQVFYPSILGAVLIGIAVALILERRKIAGGAVGLGLGGAICINLIGAAVLAAWLLIGDLRLPLRGYLVLWSLVVVLVGVSAIEIVVHSARGGLGAPAN